MVRFLIVVLLIAACVPAAAQNLVANGDFEDSYFGHGYIGWGGPSYMYGWYVEPDSVELIGDLWQAASGGQSLDLNGVRPGAVWQDLATTAGTSYALSFAMAGNPDSASVKSMEVWWGNTKLDTLRFDTTGHSATNMGWTYHTYIVTGTGLDKLRFASVGPNDCYGPTLDDVSVTQTPVPEPSSLLALLGGVGILAPMLCRRRQ